MLGTLVPVCKEFTRMVKCNHKLWEPFLRQLLRQLYDNAIEAGNNPSPLIERTDWRQSTSMVRWIDSIIDPVHMEKQTINWHVFGNLDEYVDEDDGEDKDEEIVHHHRWLFQDVSLRDYYHEAGRMAYLNIKDEYDSWEESCEQSNRCVACHEKIWNGCSCDGKRGDVDYSDFANLPNIQWWG